MLAIGGGGWGAAAAAASRSRRKLKMKSEAAFGPWSRPVAANHKLDRQAVARVMAKSANAKMA